MPKKETWSKLKITVLRKLYWGTLRPKSEFFQNHKSWLKIIRIAQNILLGDTYKARK